MSKKMKVTRTYAQRVDGGALITDGTGHPAVIMWSSDYAKLRRAWRLVEKIAALELGNPDGLDPRQHWVDEARRIVRKK